MLRMVRECARFAPLAVGVHLERRSGSDTVSIGDTESGTAPDDAGAASRVSAAYLHDDFAKQLCEAVQVGRRCSSRAEDRPVHSCSPLSLGVTESVLTAPPRRIF